MNRADDDDRYGYIVHQYYGSNGVASSVGCWDYDHAVRCMADTLDYDEDRRYEICRVVPMSAGDNTEFRARVIARLAELRAREESNDRLCELRNRATSLRATVECLTSATSTDDEWMRRDAAECVMHMLTQTESELREMEAKVASGDGDV